MEPCWISFADILCLSVLDAISNTLKFFESNISSALHHLTLSHPSTSDSQTSSGSTHPLELKGHKDFFSGGNKGSVQGVLPLYICWSR